MVTNVIMKREVMGSEISQRSDNGFFSATELCKAGNVWRVNNGLPFFNMVEWFRTKSTIEFMDLMQKEFGDVKINSKGKNQHTWVHPYLFIDMALAINPQLKLQVYDWIFDKLIQYRNESGDSYKKMSGALYLTCANKSHFKNEIINIANRVREACKVVDWETANENQLKLRDKIHDNISLLSDIIRDRELLIITSIRKAVESK